MIWRVELVRAQFFKDQGEVEKLWVVILGSQNVFWIEVVKETKKGGIYWSVTCLDSNKLYRIFKGNKRKEKNREVIGLSCGKAAITVRNSKRKKVLKTNNFVKAYKDISHYFFFTHAKINYYTIYLF